MDGMTTAAPPTETTITATDLARGLSDILNRIQYRGERFVVERNGVAIATLGPTTPTRRQVTLAELAEFLGTLPPLDEDYEADIQAVRDMLPPLRPEEWE
jgi:antitoxin (DNA-binding transcriptional repressor) of toxin-antitoxin stability system